MSTDIATLGIKVDSSDVRGASGDLRNLTEVGGKAEKATDSLSNAFGGLKSALIGLGVGALVKEAIELGDTYSNIRGRLSLVTSGTAELNSVTEKLFDSAQRARVGFEATTDLYSSLARSTKTLGTSQSDLLQVTETINKALIVSGASAATAEGALTQLSQGFASGTLRGDELNAVLEGTPRLAQAIADGMGVTVGLLRSLGAEGKITGETVFNALKTQKDAVEQEFAKMPTTVAQSFVVLRNEILKYVGETDQASGVTATLAGGVSVLAKNLDVIVPLVATLAVGLGVGFVTSAVAARIAAVETAGGITAVGIAARSSGAALLGMFGGPVGLAITAVTIGVAGFASESSRSGQIVDTVNKSYDEMKKRLAAANTEAELAAKGSAGVGSSAKSAVPGIESLTGAVKGLADQLFRQADAAKKARIEMAATSLAEARKNENAVAALTPAARNSSGSKFVRGDFLNNASVIYNAVTGAGLSVLSGGRTDREAEAAYKRAVQVSRQAKIELDKAYESTNSSAGGASKANEAEIKKLQGQVNDLKKVRESVTGEERKRVDKKIATGERKIELLGTGASEKAVNDAVGSGGGSGSSGKTDKQREYESAVKASENYIEQLKKEREQVGLNTVGARLVDAQREAAKAPTEALRQAILNEANAWASSTVMQEANEAVRKSLTDDIERQRKATETATNTGREMLAQLEFETRLQNMSSSERAVAIAQRDLETRGIREGTLAWDLYGRSILEAAQSRGNFEDQADSASAIADHMRAVNDNVREATDSFGELFGRAGEGFASLIEIVSNYAEKSAEAEARIAEAKARYGEESIQAKQAEAQASEEASQRELQTYGQVIRGVKGMFKEKSTAYKVMEAAEKTYAAVRLAMAVKELVTEGLLTTAKVSGAGVRMATDTAETASSVAKSGIRAAADGVAAFAKTLASLPFPFNIAAGAVVLAALAGVGVAIAGGGGGGKAASATADAEPAKPTDYANQDSKYSVLQTQPGYGDNRNVGFSNDNRSSAPAAVAMSSVGGSTTIKLGDNYYSGFTNQDLAESIAESQQQTVKQIQDNIQQDRVRGSGRQQIGGIN